MRDGVGVMQRADGSRYEGEFRRNFRHGIGVMYCDRGKIVRGGWKNNKFVG